MFPSSGDQKDLGRYLAIGQVGLEMVAPIALGWVVDTYAGISPWGVVAGALFGFVGGIAHLVLITNPKSPKKISGPATPDQSKPEETR